MLRELTQAVEEAGFCLCGGFELDGAQRHALPANCASAGTVVLIGNAGPAMWDRFAASPHQSPDPLDGWTKESLIAVAERFGAVAVFPFQRPYLPFQQWLMKAEPCHLSPLGIVLHPRYGLWHALRGALLFAQKLKFPPVEAAPSPCGACQERPCLKTCPVGAFGAPGYDTASCLAELNGGDAGSCMALGCLARRACPIGADYRYASAQAAFHMQAFRNAFRAGPPLDRL
jgi:hypothetical protein